MSQKFETTKSASELTDITTEAFGAQFPNRSEAQLAYAACERELDELDASEVARITTDVPAAVITALGVLPRIQTLLPVMRELLKAPPEAEIARLGDRARAVFYAHIRYLPRGRALEAELEEARVLRELLLEVADAHAAAGQIARDEIAQIREGAGHLDRVGDLLALGELYANAWEVVGDQTPIKKAQVDRAVELGNWLLSELGAKSVGGGQVDEGRVWSDRRNRAFRLFLRDYRKIRAAVTYVRDEEGDADTFAPSLFQRARAGSSVEEEEPTAPVAPTPSTPTTG